MPGLISPPPTTAIEPVTDVLHGVPITDPYRWLEDQNSPPTRAWIEEQTAYARSYLDNIPGRERVRRRIREFLAVETYDSPLKASGRYFFRKRLAQQEQPCICFREGPAGKDELLVDPSALGNGKYTAVKPLRVSSDGKLLLYEIKEGGERTGTFALLDIESRKALPDVLPRGYLRGFAFSRGSRGFYYVHEPADSSLSGFKRARHHLLGTDFAADQTVFCAGEGRVRLGLISDGERIGFLVYKFEPERRMDFYVQGVHGEETRECIVADAPYDFAPLLTNGRIFAVTNCDAPNLRVIEVRRRNDGTSDWVDLIPERDGSIRRYLVVGDRILVSYLIKGRIRISSFTLAGEEVGEIAASSDETLRLVGTSADDDEVFLETESFTQPIRITRYCPQTGETTTWCTRAGDCDPPEFVHTRVSFPSKDGTAVPMYLVGKPNVLAQGCHPAIMTAYGGYGLSMTPQFSVFAAFLMERGCLFAIPNIRGGSEFGAAWHEAAKRRRRQTAYDDFLSAAQWLIGTGRTTAKKLAIFGGSNSGLLAGVAMTQRPDLFRAVVCMVPMLDMLRYHHFDSAHVWRDEFGTSDDAEDFSALLQYSPYHHVRDGVEYPAAMLVSGDADQNCNPLHARKMVARLQAANGSVFPVLLHYNRFRGHSPVLPLSDRIEALTDRMAFLCAELELPV